MQVIEGGDKSTPEMDVVIPPISLRSINAVSSHIPVVQAAREQIVTEMENMLIVGVQELVGFPPVTMPNKSSWTLFVHQYQY